MEIDRTSAARPQWIPPVQPPTVSAATTSPATTSPATGELEAAEPRLDRIELSAAAREIGPDLDVVREPGVDPEVTREQALAALRAQIDAGTYRVDADGVARRIVARGDL